MVNILHHKMFNFVYPATRITKMNVKGQVNSPFIPIEDYSFEPFKRSLQKDYK